MLRSAHPLIPSLPSSSHIRRQCGQKQDGKKGGVTLLPPRHNMVDGKKVSDVRRRREATPTQLSVFRRSFSLSPSPVNSPFRIHGERFFSLLRAHVCLSALHACAVCLSIGGGGGGAAPEKEEIRPQSAPYFRTDGRTKARESDTGRTGCFLRPASSLRERGSHLGKR